MTLIDQALDVPVDTAHVVVAVPGVVQVGLKLGVQAITPAWLFEIWAGFTLMTTAWFQGLSGAPPEPPDSSYILPPPHIAGSKPAGTTGTGSDGLGSGLRRRWGRG